MAMLISGERTKQHDPKKIPSLTEEATCELYIPQQCTGPKTQNTF